ncbi:4-aminobutyrate--2-oxoglutarate transaminase [Leucobacter sp. cx-42]|uniref:4-aminobutyrate--2-oxoglutarate transaminase n=1 Tax=unclassified Leucobacter TaxID=2621730 RepID=UPI00165DE278|nr:MULTISPECIES: 4-aminobutyrate--2-oxoglutarate transaminase [unclassified Leucobacter]MBC9954706.1 4-aminobutyrate--2-oxoglutarate transaminase [Leucobacter sp. cx-42]
MSDATVIGGPSLPQERKLVTSIPGPKSQEIIARKNAAVAAGVGAALPISVVAGGDGVLVDVDGNSLIDLGSGIAVTGVGNSAPRVVKAVQEQVAQFTHTCFTVTPYEGYVAVAEKLNELTPGDHEKRSALFNSGAEAVENAIKIARHYTRKNGVVVFDHAYHGRTNLTMGMTAKNMPYKEGYGPFAPELYRVPASYPYRDGLTGAEAAAQAISQIEKQVGANNLAAIIIEPIQGEGGFIAPAEGFLPAIQEWATANKVVFILDEVQTGFARTGQMFAANFEGVVPDMITTAKGIAGGLPLSAVTGRAEIMDSSHAGGLGGTYTGSPVACAAALATIETYLEDDLLSEAKRIEATITEVFSELQKSDDRIGEIRGRGAMMAVELVESGSKKANSALTNKVAQVAADQGVLALTCGTYGNVIRFLPSLTISDALLREGLQVVVDAIKAN